MKAARTAAKEILDNLQYLFQGPDEIVSAVETDFPHIDFSKYRDVETELSKHGYVNISDIELVNLSNDPSSLFRKTLIRSFSSPNGDVVVSCYEIRPKFGRRMSLLIQGLLSFRWIAAPIFFIKTIPTRLMIDFESEFSDGTFIGTTNSQDAGLIKGPPTVDGLCMPYSTTLENLRITHEKRVKMRNENVITRVVKSDSDLLEMQKRLKLEKSAHRSSTNWISYDEILAMSQGQTELAKEVHEEIQKLISKQIKE